MLDYIAATKVNSGDQWANYKLPYRSSGSSCDACACHVGAVPVGDDSGTFPSGTVVSTQVGQSDHILVLNKW